jgi:hypothetical protein
MLYFVILYFFLFEAWRIQGFAVSLAPLAGKRLSHQHHSGELIPQE